MSGVVFEQLEILDLQAHEFPTAVFHDISRNWKPFPVSKVSRFFGSMLIKCCVNEPFP
jgi:hypothetical protein